MCCFRINKPWQIPLKISIRQVISSLLPTRAVSLIVVAGTMMVFHVSSDEYKACKCSFLRERSHKFGTPVIRFSTSLKGAKSLLQASPHLPQKKIKKPCSTRTYEVGRNEKAWQIKKKYLMLNASLSDLVNR